MHLSLYLLTTAACLAAPTLGLGQVIYAVNCGGEAHVDRHGVRYERDPLHGIVGTASDYGKRHPIQRVHEHDRILYQTERYHTDTFGYDIPATADGDYVLVLKFSEVYFTNPNEKIFNVVLNGDHAVVSQLDIYDRVGQGVAHDELVPYRIHRGRLHVRNEDSEIRGGRIRVEFIKGPKDNPKINAIVVVRGTVQDVPELEAMPVEPEPIGLHDDTPPVGSNALPKEDADSISENLRPSPKLPDPYMNDDSSTMLPIFIAIGAFIPLLFCLCKL